MSQDAEVCAKCGERCGYEDGKGYWEGRNLALCSSCRGNLTRRFCAFFGLDGCASTDMALEIGWNDIDRILAGVKRDECRMASYVVTDREMYSREVMVKTPIENDILSPIHTPTLQNVIPDYSRMNNK